MTTKITLPVANGKTKISSFLETASPDATFIVVSVIADQPLILNVQQAYDEDFFDSIGAEEYTDVGTESTFRFPRVGVKNFFTLSNTSGTDCTFTRAFAEFRNQTSTNIVAIDQTLSTNDDLSHTKLDTLNTNIQALNQSIIGLQKQSPVYYRELGDAYYAFCPEFTASTTDNVELVAFNPLGSGKTAYLYHISFSSKAPVLTEDYNVTVKMDKITGVEGGTDLTPLQTGNLNLGLNTQSDLILRTKPTSETFEGRILNKRLEKSGDSNIISFQNEFIEIPEGHGVSFTVQSTSTTVSMTFNLRYFEELSNAPPIPPTIAFTSVIPDEDPQGNAIRTDQAGLNVYRWSFTTTADTSYNLFALTNPFTTSDGEKMTKLYLAGDPDETNLLNNTMFSTSTGGLTVVEDNNIFNMLFAPSLSDPNTVHGTIELAPNTTFEFVMITDFNDADTGNPDIQFGIVSANELEIIALQYLSGVAF